MRIDDVNRTPQTLAAERSKLGSDHSRNNTVSENVDRSEISNLALGLGAGSEKRLESLRVAVEAGTYRVSATGLAAKIIEAHFKAPE